MKVDAIMMALSRKPSEKFQAAADRHPSVRRSVARALIAMDSGKWDESKHPRRKDGKFGNGGGQSSSVSSEETPVSVAPAVFKLSKLTRTARETLSRKQNESNNAMAQKCRKLAETLPEGSHERIVYQNYAASLSKPAAGRPTHEESKALTQKYASNISKQLRPAAVERYLRDLSNEPQITSDICDIADEIGTNMYGLDYRLKKASDSSDGGCRIQDKILEDMEKNNRTYEQSVGYLSDMVRYTQACTAETLSENFDRTRSILEEKGYRTIKVKNSWDNFSLDRPYRGLNCVFESPTGTRFELQFHTAESLVAKEVQHGQYEEQRDPRTPPERKSELAAIMYRNMQAIQSPKNTKKIQSFSLDSRIFLRNYDIISTGRCSHG